MDRSAIFAELTKRNALRRAHGLPLVDMRAEYDHAIAVAAQRDYQALCDAHAADREAIREEVLTELRARHGANFGHTWGGRWAIGEMTRKRFAALMAQKYCMFADGAGPARNAVVYGRGAKDAT